MVCLSGSSKGRNDLWPLFGGTLTDGVMGVIKGLNQISFNGTCY